MKKKLLGVLLASFALVSVSQARFYVGVEGGYSAEAGYNAGTGAVNSFTFFMPNPSIIGDSLKYGYKGYSVGAVFGTEDFFGKYFGTRWGISAGYSSFKDSASYIDTGLNLDLMLNFVNTGSFSLGVFGGVGLDYAYILDDLGAKAEFAISKHLLDLTGRVGLSALFASHHRIEFIAKLPMASMSMSDSKAKMLLGGRGSHSRTTLGASYKFVF